jgi:phosphomannomutase/phosphoglucomutase
MSIFKPCDIRGRYPREIDAAKAYRIGRAVATTLGGQPVVVGGDVRLSTPNLKTAVSDGLAASGSDVIDVGIVSTPMFNFARARLNIRGGVMVTASHNPPEYNGLKIVLGDLPITEEELSSMRALSETNGFLSRVGRVRQLDIVPDYESDIISKGAALLEAVEPLPRVVLDCGNGCCSEVAPRVFERLSIPFVPLFCEIDGMFPNRGPNSAVAKNLKALCEAVVGQDAGMGAAFDGDGDRVAFVDHAGNVLTADETVAIIATHLNGGVGPGDKVVLDIKLSGAVSEVVAGLGAEPLTERAGHTFIKTRMIQEDAAFGGEASGHLFYRELGGGDDGLYSAILMASIVGKHGALSKLAAQVPHYATTPEYRVHIEHDPRLLEAIAEAFPPEMVSRQDGVRVQFKDGWGLARLSVTEPVITLRFEGRNRAALERVMERFLAPVPELRKRLQTERKQ